MTPGAPDPMVGAGFGSIRPVDAHREVAESDHATPRTENPGCKRCRNTDAVIPAWRYGCCDTCVEVRML